MQRKMDQHFRNVCDAQQEAKQQQQLMQAQGQEKQDAQQKQLMVLDAKVERLLRVMQAPGHAEEAQQLPETMQAAQ